MADKSKKATKASKPNATASEGKRNGKEKQVIEKKQTEQQKRKSNSKLLAYFSIIIIIIIIALLVYFMFTNSPFATPFPTFLANFNSAPRVAFVVEYGNNTQYGLTAACSEYVIETIAHTRNASTIDFFIMNKTTCYYSASGLGHQISGVSTKPASACLNASKAEPSIYLNYSSVNSTRITPYHLYVDGNAAYMQTCGIATDLGS
jgi:hypothetical protein